MESVILGMILPRLPALTVRSTARSDCGGQGRTAGPRRHHSRSVPGSSPGLEQGCPKPGAVAAPSGPRAARPWSPWTAPGDSPTTRAKVFFDTVPGDLPPRARMASSASSRV